MKNFSRRLLPTWTASISKGEVKKGSKITSAIAIDYLTISCVLEHDQEITFSSIANPRNIFEISNSRKLLLILCVRGISLPLSG
ncbi:MAG: hypothetical protein DRJ40_08605 [Thermoprotei archaeon]|nr:MAG: hypothetical protein DRJ40_08605 [Thermoprotei archaeon]